MPKKIPKVRLNGDPAGAAKVPLIEALPIKIQDADDVDKSAKADDRILVWKDAQNKHIYEDKPAGGVTRSPVTLIVAANNSKYKTRADYECDGTADQAEINQAILDLPAGGGKIVLLDGTFNLLASIILQKNRVTIQGQGANTILFSTANMNDHMLQIGWTDQTIYGTTIGDIDFNGNRANQTEAKDGIHLFGSAMLYSVHAITKNCVFENVKRYCIYNEHAEFCRIFNNEFKNSDTAIYMLRVPRSAVTLNAFYNLACAEVSSAVHLGNCYYSSFSSNEFYNINRVAMHITGCENFTCHDNVILNFSLDGANQYSAIMLSGDSQYGTICNNSIRGQTVKGKYGIEEIGDSVHDNIYIGNTIRGVQSGEIKLTSPISYQGYNLPPDNMPIIEMTASEAIAKFDCVYISADNTVSKTTGSTSAILGIALANISNGAQGFILTAGSTKANISGTCVAGDLLVGATDGKVIKFTPTTSKGSGSHYHEIRMGGDLYEPPTTYLAEGIMSIVSGEFAGGKIIGKALEGGTDTLIKIVVWPCG